MRPSLERARGSSAIGPRGASAAATATFDAMNLLFLISLVCAFVALALPKVFSLMGRRR